MVETKEQSDLVDEGQVELWASGLMVRPEASGAETDSKRRSEMSKNAFDFKRGTLFMIDPDDPNLIIIEDKKHPLYDPRIELPVDEALVLSVMADGVQSPIFIMKDNEDHAVVVAGRQRVRAAREANARLKKKGEVTMDVPARLFKGTEADLFGISVTENEIRRNDSPMMKAKKANKLILMGKSNSEVAIKFGVTPTAIGNWLKLLECSAKVRDAVDREQLSATAATKFIGLTHPEQDKLLDELLAAQPTMLKVDGMSKALAVQPGITEKAPVKASEFLAKYGKKKKLTVKKVAAATNTGLSAIKSQREIQTAFEKKFVEKLGKGQDYEMGYQDALQWVLGKSGGQKPTAAKEAATRHSKGESDGDNN